MNLAETTSVEPIDRLIEELQNIRRDMLIEADRVKGERPPGHRGSKSRTNLLQYMVLRRRDLRPMQRELERLGLSSLGRAEAHALATIDAVLGALVRLRSSGAPPLGSGRGLSFDEGREVLARHTAEALGPLPKARSVRIMVTMPSEAANDYGVVREMIRSGMDIARINCAHDDPAAWARMIANIERAGRELARPTRVMMDLAGPKLRTGRIELGPSVIKLAPRRDPEGRMVVPSRVLLAADTAPSEGLLGTDGTLVVPGAWLSHGRAGTRVHLEDLRGKGRELQLVAPVGASWIAELSKTAYIGLATKLKFVGLDDVGPATLLDIPAKEQKIVLRPGDLLRVVKDAENGGRSDAAKGSTARIGCTLPAVFDRVRPGDRIWFDDGKIGGIVVKREPEAFEVKISQAAASGSKLGSDKGINLPDTDLGLPFLSDKDREDLRFIAANASMVGLSFVQSPEDLEELATELGSIGKTALAVVIKVETRHAFEHLPELLLAAVGRWPVGVMIARGDLAVEISYERLAEVQEEILWISEAAHVPVIWATAVLETLARKGIPSRAEITDAAMSQRAECVMLNKGPYVLDAIRVLDDILRRMDAHQRKKTAFLRPLRVSLLG